MKGDTGLSITIMAVIFILSGWNSGPLPAQTPGPGGSPAIGSIDETIFEELKDTSFSALIRRLEAFPAGEALEYAAALALEAGARGDTDRALSIVRWGRRKAAEAGMLPEEARLLQLEGLILVRTGDPEDSAAIISRAADIFLRAGEVDEFASALSLAGNIRHGYGALNRAARDFDRVIGEGERISDQLLLASALTEGAMVRYKAGDLENVPGLLEKALVIYTEAGQKNGIGTVHRIYGNYYVGLGRPGEALKSYETARGFYIETGNAHDFANTSYNIGLLLRDSGSIAESISYMINAVENFANAGSLSGAGMAATELARSFMLLGDFPEADRFLRQAMEHLKKEHSYRRLAMAVMVLGDLEERQDNREAALAAYREAATLFDRLELSREAFSVRRLIQELERKIYGGREL